MGDFEDWYRANARPGEVINVTAELRNMSQASQADLDRQARGSWGGRLEPIGKWGREVPRPLAEMVRPAQPAPRKRPCGVCGLHFSRFDFGEDDRCQQCWEDMELPSGAWEREAALKANRQAWWLRVLRWFADL